MLLTTLPSPMPLLPLLSLPLPLLLLLLLLLSLQSCLSAREDGSCTLGVTTFRISERRYPSQLTEEIIRI